MKTKVETLRFQAEVQELLGLVIHSLYKHREIFLRELISNASDALDKLRFEALTRPELSPPGASAKIRIEIDRDARSLTIADDGIGMDRGELEANLGTIARSGTKEFLARLHAQKSENTPELIGQFGVGFYSSFMVAREVVVETRRAGSDEAWRWRSEGRGEYTVEPCEKETAGTRVTLYLRDAAEGEDDEQDFLSEWTVRDIVKRYSDFVAYPIEMEVESEKGERRTEVLNSMKPLWAKPKDEIERETYDEFYRHLTHDFEAPLEVIHFKAEGTNEYTALLYLPSHRPVDLFEGPEARSRIALYVRRVLIMPDCADLLPAWMRFVRGVVDSADLPLNVSRDVLQSNTTVRQIGRRLTKRVLETLATVLKDDREKYDRFWSAFGALLKEGIYVGDDTDGAIAKIALFATTHAEQGQEVSPSPMTTLGEYVGRMKPDQKAIYYLAGSDRAALAASPHVEAMKRRGFEVLLFVDPIDEFFVQRMREFEKKPLAAIDRGDLELDSKAEQEARENLERDNRDLLTALEEALATHVKNVRFTTRLSGSAAVLVNDAHGLSPHMERVLRAAHQDVKSSKRVLELDPDHPVVKKLIALHRETPRSPLLAEAAELVYGQALLAEGSSVPDGARFAKLVAKWMLGSSE